LQVSNDKLADLADDWVLSQRRRDVILPYQVWIFNLYVNLDYFRWGWLHARPCGALEPGLFTVLKAEFSGVVKVTLRTREVQRSLPVSTAGTE
jgi:hypothetical protein